MEKVYICPTDKRHNCPWEGNIDEIYDHFINDHEDLLCHSNEIYFNLGITSENILLMHEEEIYLVQHSIQDNTLYISLRFLGLPEIARKINYNVSFDGNPEYVREALCLITRNGRWEINLKQIVNHQISLNSIVCCFMINKAYLIEEESAQESSDGEATEVVEERTVKVRKNHSYNCGYQTTTKSALNRSVRHKSVILVRKESRQVNRQVNRLSSVDTDLLSNTIRKDMPDITMNILKPEDFSEENLICCTCEKIMLPPIYLCKNGHSTCSSCKQSLCKICESNITNNRNENLEHISRNFLYPCKFLSEGCEEKLRYNKLLDHEIRCSFCIYSCPIQDCPTKGIMNIFHNHIQVFHKGIKISTSLQNECPRGSEFFVVSAQKGVFYCICLLRGEFIEWQVIFCGPKERQFFCEIYFKNHKNKDSIYLKRNKEKYTVRKHISELKKLKIKDKHAVLEITSYD